MSSTTPKSALIIGAGLSGTLVATQLLRKNWRVTVIDNGVNHSSLVAAGIINPLVFRRMTKSWRLDEFTDYLIPFYRELEAQSESRFFHPITIRRLFSGLDERHLWLDKQNDVEFSKYMESISKEDDSYNQAINEHGSARVKNAFWIDTEVFLSSMKIKLACEARVIQTDFHYNDLIGNTHQGESYDAIIFCEGYLGKENPWFGELPLTQTKGETLTISTDQLPEDVSLNRKCFVLPIGDQTFKIGSTYTWNTTDLDVTKEGKKLILENLGYILNNDVTVLQQNAGIRPTTVDRRPLIGTHPTHSNYHIFNGLGAKGYMMAPLLSKEFVDYLDLGSSLHPEVRITRCKTKSTAE